MNEHTMGLLGIGVGMAGLLGTMIAAWINVKTKLAAMEVKILEVEKDIRRADSDIREHKEDVKEYMEKVDKSLGNIYKGVTDIKVALANKADKK